MTATMNRIHQNKFRPHLQSGRCTAWKIEFRKAGLFLGLSHPDHTEPAEHFVIDLVTGERQPVYEREIERRVGSAVQRDTGYGPPTLVLWTWGDDQLGELQLAYVTGDCPWEVVEDKFRDLGLMD